MNCLNKIDWKLFKKQKMFLVKLAPSAQLTLKQVALIDGILNMMDAMQDEFEPTKGFTNERKIKH